MRIEEIKIHQGEVIFQEDYARKTLTIFHTLASAAAGLSSPPFSFFGLLCKYIPTMGSSKQLNALSSNRS